MTTRRPTRSLSARSLVARTLLVGVVPTLLVAGCGPAGSDDVPAVPGAAVQSPIDRYLAPSIQTWRQARVTGANAREDALAACMAKRGFTYVPQYTTPAPTPTAADHDTEAWVTQYGYGLYRTDGAPVLSSALSKENEDYFFGLSSKERDAYLLTQFGDEPEGGAKRVVGCTTADEDADPERSAATKKVTADRAELAKQAAVDPAWFAADQEWAGCMAEAGHGGFARQSDARASMVKEYQPLYESFGDGTLPEDKVAPVFKKERTLALADFRCVHETGFSPATSAVTDRLEQTYVTTHRAQLDAVVTAYASAS